MEEKSDEKKPLFRDIAADDEQETSEIESLCMNCHENGVTRLLLTKIPFFKEVILMSFSCPHCHFKNNEIQSGGSIADKGCKCALKVTSEKDLNRQVVKSDSAGFCIQELDFESPAFTQKGELNTIEGLLAKAVSGLQQEQPVRRALAPEIAEKIDQVIEKLKKCQLAEMPFTFVLDDAAGNSIIENPFAPADDPNMTVELYARTSDQDAKLGISTPDEEAPQKESESSSAEGAEKLDNDDQSKPENVKDEVLTFPSNCSNCNSPVETRMKVVDIPHFKEVIIMATTCDACGHKTNEVKSGSGIESKGTKITLNVTDPEDLNRDVLKSETCELEIPELNFRMQSGTLGGRFTTLEGLLTNIIDQLKTLLPFGFGDSPAFPDSKLHDSVAELEKVASGDNLKVHIILDDPAGNSYLQNYYAPDEDPEMTVEHYVRTHEQDDELGILGLKTEGYEETG